MKPKFSNEQIIRKLNSGDSIGFNLVFDKFYTPLVYFASRITKDIDDSKDIVSTLFCELAAQPKQFENIGKLTAFLYISIKNRCLKYLEHQKVVLKSVRGLTHTTDTFIESDVVYAEAQEVRSRFLHMLYEEIEKLPVARKNVFKMSYIDQCTTEQICEALNMSKESVYNNKLKAIKQLRRLLIARKAFCIIALLETLQVIEC